MIVVDDRIGSIELRPLIIQQGVECDKYHFPYGDAIFQGNGPTGPISIAFERKKLSDIFNCIKDGRYSGHQAIGLHNYYDLAFFILEGNWRPSKNGWILEGYEDELGRTHWKYFNNRKIPYGVLQNAMTSIAMSGVVTTYSLDINHTVRNIISTFKYFQKKWNDHDMLKKFHRLNIPTLQEKPSLVQEWASKLEGIGVKKNEAARLVFKSGYDLATADETDWMRVDGVTPRLARSIIKEIHGLT